MFAIITEKGDGYMIAEPCENFMRLKIYDTNFEMGGKIEVIIRDGKLQHNADDAYKFDLID